MIRRIVLIGFSGTGKSTVGRRLAERLGWTAIDTDAEIEAERGRTVPEIFASDGEPVFRAVERRQVLAALQRPHSVIATGGGAVIDAELWSPDLLGSPETLVIALDAEPSTIFARLSEHAEREGSSAARPMLAGDDPRARIAELKAKRQHVYDRADVTFIVDAIDPDALVEEILSLPGLTSGTPKPSVTLRTPSAQSDIYIAPGIAAHAGELIRRHWPNARRAWIVSDDHVGPIHGPSIANALTSADFSVDRRDVPAGESSKSWATAGDLVDWVLTGGIERGDVVLALGGGVVGDLAGFVAAIALRGVPLVQVPTSLLAMVDSSVGGKTGINHRTGKNLIGAFWQPPLVLIDPLLLKTLPERELRSGWAEIVKHAFIQPSTPGGERADLIRFLERNLDALKRLDEPATTYLIRRNVALKAAVVAADERESGIRAYLNFGHTIGHAIEASGYRYLHGEAIAVGLRAAMRIGEEMGLADTNRQAALDRLLIGFGLPTTAEASQSDVLQKMTSDKKRARGVQRWVLPASGGGVEMRSDVPDSAVRTALETVLVVNEHNPRG